MVAEKQTKCANFLQIMSALRSLLDEGKITEKEYKRAKEYYQKLTGADIIIPD